MKSRAAALSALSASRSRYWSGAVCAARSTRCNRRRTPASCAVWRVAPARTIAGPFIAAASRSTSARRSFMASHEMQLAADLGKDVEGTLQILARMRGRDDRPDAGLVPRHGRKPDALREHPVGKQAIGERHRQGAVTDDHRGDRALAHAGVEAQRPQTCLEEP